MQAVRLARIDPATGQTMVLKGARGELRDVVVDQHGERAWLLMTHGMHEVTLDPFTIRRTLGRPLGTYQHTALRLDDDVILISRETGRVAQLVSTTTMEVIGRIHIAAPQLAVPMTTGVQLLGFGSRQARTLTPEHQPSGKPRGLPLGRTPIATSRGVAFLPALTGRRFTEIEAASEVDPFTRASPIGNIAFLDPTTLMVDSTAPNLGIGSLHGTDPSGRLIVSDHGHDPEPGSTLAVLDLTAQRTEGIVGLPSQLDAIAPVPGMGAVIRPFEHARTPKSVWIARWQQEATPVRV
jgi:hypothetical protein